jgi:hypothetical protein
MGKWVEESGTSENENVSLKVKRKSRGPKGEVDSDLKDRIVYEEGASRAERNGNGKRNRMGQQATIAGKAETETGGQSERSGTPEAEREARKGNGNGKQLREVNRVMIEQNGKQETEPDGRNNRTEGRTLGMITRASKSGGQSVLASKKNIAGRVYHRGTEFRSKGECK